MLSAAAEEEEKEEEKEEKEEKEAYIDNGVAAPGMYTRAHE
jgi:hypothetical protein